MNGAAETRPAGGERGFDPLAIRISGPRRRAGALTAYGWAALCALAAVTLLAVALILH